MDGAAMAAESDPARNRQFARRWTDPPPQKRRRPALDGTSNRAAFIDGSSKPEPTGPDAMAQRGIAAALRRADQLERRASILARIGQRPAAVRLASIACELRAVAE
jgi:hypothetical protein